MIAHRPWVFHRKVVWQEAMAPLHTLNPKLQVAGMEAKSAAAGAGVEDSSEEGDGATSAAVEQVPLSAVAPTLS